MQDDNFSTTPLNELITSMAYLEQEINMKLLIYEKMRAEVCKRFPSLEKEEDFKPKVLKIKREKR